MKTKYEDFEVVVPDLEGGGVAERVKVQVPLEWDEELNQWLLAPEAHEIIEDTKARHMGLLLPAQFKELRERFGYTQKQMGELFQAGEKSWTRWESGKHRPSRMVSLLVRALYDGEVSIGYLLTKAGKPARHEAELKGRAAEPEPAGLDWEQHLRLLLVVDRRDSAPTSASNDWMIAAFQDSQSGTRNRLLTRYSAPKTSQIGASLAIPRGSAHSQFNQPTEA